MTRFHLLFFWWAALLVLVCCGTEPPVHPERNIVTREDLLAFNQEKAEQERMFIDSLVACMHSAAMPHYVETATGLRAWSSEPLQPLEMRLQPGDTVEWVGELMLTDSTVLSIWTQEEPLRFAWNRSDWPAGFHELATTLTKKQRAVCIVPSYLAWGLTGYPPLVPQEAVLLLNIEQRLPNSSEAAAINTRETRAIWNALLDGMERGEWPGDADWIEAPQLAASPCMAWYEGSEGFAFESKPDRVRIELRTFRLSNKDGLLDDLGASSWEFDVQDDGQLFPVLADLQRLYPLKRKWACWCPADAVLDEPGREALGVSTSDVLGFQWEFQAEANSLSVQ